ncbi:MAG TPA: hypothetical protein ENK02_09540 [Planctomycetes bacterium]|nr:hypothetical protein [Planctomycetota bacterium]
MNRIALATTVALFPSFLWAQQPVAKKAIRFPLRCDRSLPSDGTLFLLESAPISLLEKHGKHFFPLQFVKTGIASLLISLEAAGRPGWKRYRAALPKLLAELRGFDQGFSLAGMYFPYKDGERTILNPEGFSVFGQSSNKQWVLGQWDRLATLFRDPKTNTHEERALGGSPISSNWIYDLFIGPDGNPSQGVLGVVGHARRGKFASFFTASYYGWREEYSKKQLARVLHSGEHSLAAGLGILKNDHKGNRIEGIDVFRPQGTTLGRVLVHLGTYMEKVRANSKTSHRNMEEMEALGLLSIFGIQDTVWVENETIREKIQVREWKGRNSVFDGLAPLDSDATQYQSLLPPKAFGFLRLRLSMDWLHQLLERIQAQKRMRLRPENLARVLNLIRSLLALPIPKNPASLDDFQGTQEIVVFFSPPSPGSFWPEIFILTPKKGTSLKPHQRLQKLAGFFYKIRIPNYEEKDPAYSKSVKDKGKGTTSYSYVNYGKVISEHEKKNWFTIPVGALPGAGIFSAAQTEDYSILCFAPSAMRSFLKTLSSGKGKTDKPEWIPQEALGHKGDLLQGVLRLQELAKTFPWKLAFAGMMVASPHKRKIPGSADIARLFTTEAFRIYRLPPQGEDKGLLVMDHSGSGLVSLHSWATFFYGGLTSFYLKSIFH